MNCRENSNIKQIKSVLIEFSYFKHFICCSSKLLIIYAWMKKLIFNKKSILYARWKFFYIKIKKRILFWFKVDKCLQKVAKTYLREESIYLGNDWRKKRKQNHGTKNLVFYRFFAPWVVKISIASHNSKYAKKSNKKIQHIKIQREGSWNMLVSTIISQNVRSIIKNEPAKKKNAACWHREMHHCTTNEEHIN